MRRGFSMAELMVTVAIIGVLSAIAVPTWRESQFRTKRAEIPANVAGIQTAELGYYAAWSKFVAQVEPLPRALSMDGTDRVPTDWPRVGNGQGFDTIGWSPNGAVRGSYSVPIGDGDELLILGSCNVDGDDSDAASYWASESMLGDWEDSSFY